MRKYSICGVERFVLDDGYKELRRGRAGCANDVRKTIAASNAVLVPLTNSLYVKGELSNTESVLVDVGTGFLIEKVSSPCVPIRGRVLIP